MNEKAVVLMYYGFPSSVDEMHDYLKDILHGREPSQSLIDENVNKLKIIGGKTPSIEIVENIKKKLHDKISKYGYNVYLFTKHYKPSLRDAFSSIKERTVYEIPLFPIYSKQIFDDYFVPIEQTLGIRDYHRIVNIGLHGKMIDFFRNSITDNGFLAFSAHSIPIRGYDPYPIFLTSLANELSKGKDHILFYHSQGPYSPRWLGPDMDYVVNYLVKNKITRISVIPIGFIYEHLEILYDLDYIFKEKLDKVGIGYWRARPPNDNDVVIDAITDIMK